jgi:hypothetical protein
MTVAVLRGYYSYTDAEDAKPTITPIKSLAGLYFDEIGSVFFYPMQWKIVSYMDLKPTQRLWRQVKPHQSQIAVYCNRVKNATWYALTDCSSFTPYIKTKPLYIEQLKDVLADYLASSPERSKRGLLDVGGNILKFLFGTFIIRFHSVAYVKIC